MTQGENDTTFQERKKKKARKVRKPQDPLANYCIEWNTGFEGRFEKEIIDLINVFVNLFRRVGRTWGACLERRGR